MRERERERESERGREREREESKERTNGEWVSPTIHVAAAAKKKNISASVPPVPVRVPSQWLIAPSVMSVTSVD